MGRDGDGPASSHARHYVGFGAENLTLRILRLVSRGGCQSASIAGVILLADVLKWSEVNAVLMKSAY